MSPKRQALAVVPETQLSLAIGKQGLNVRLANRLVDWSIDVKTEAQFMDMDISAQSKRAVSALFRDYDEEEEEITRVDELPDVPENLVSALKNANIELIEDLVNYSDAELEGLEGVAEDDVKTLKRIISENIEIIEEPDSEESEEEYEEGEFEEEEAAPEGEYADEPVAEESEEAEEEEITLISELPSIPEHIVNALTNHGILDIVDLISLTDAELTRIPGVTQDDVEVIKDIIADTVEIIEQDEDDDEE